ncbi:hypothetical protein BJY01DRAFT_229485 [Aspergillus pseudoustus]|uniref:DNA2/NAM7 helicase-like C-terminal domain-containing protein n=1 Tax=Aspergillus pseudoustus TaxID=1810923 RepID=A0ABR4IGP9_9EURO
MTSMPLVADTDRMQGKERKLVLLGFVISSSESLKDLGFAVDDHRCNARVTRMNPEREQRSLEAGIAAMLGLKIRVETSMAQRSRLDAVR